MAGAAFARLAPAFPTRRNDMRMLRARPFAWALASTLLLAACQSPSQFLDAIASAYNDGKPSLTATAAP